MGLVCFEGGTRGIYEGDLPEPKVPMPTVYGTKGQIRTDGTGVIAKSNIALQTINSNQLARGRALTCRDESVSGDDRLD